MAINKRKLLVLRELFYKEGITFNSLDDMLEYILKDAVDELIKCSTYTRKKLGNLKIQTKQ